MTLFVNLGRAEGRKFRAPPQRGAAAAGPGRARLGEGRGGRLEYTLTLLGSTIAVAPMDLADPEQKDVDARLLAKGVGARSSWAGEIARSYPHGYRGKYMSCAALK
jgi:hypothetical protein